MGWWSVVLGLLGCDGPRIAALEEGVSTEAQVRAQFGEPEQVWDGEDLPELELLRGRPSGSAMPLVWAHAEFAKLCRSLDDGGVFDMPLQPARRYRGRIPASPRGIWRFNHKSRTLVEGQLLRVEVLAPAVVHWSADGWRTVTDTATRDLGVGLHVADLPVGALVAGARVDFTFRWPLADRWEGTDFHVVVSHDDTPSQGTAA